VSLPFRICFIIFRALVNFLCQFPPPCLQSLHCVLATSFRVTVGLSIACSTTAHPVYRLPHYPREEKFKVDHQNWQFQADVSQSPLYIVLLQAIDAHVRVDLDMSAECRSTRALLLGRLTTLSVPVRHRITKHLLRLSISNIRVSPSSRAFH